MAHAIVQSGIILNAPVLTLPVATVVQSGTILNAPVLTIPPVTIVQTGNYLNAPVLVPVDLSKQLILRPVVVLIATDCSYITVDDETGLYDATTNPTGYNPPGDPFDPTRPHRDDLDLYCGWIYYNPDGTSTWTFSPTQDITEDPWTIQVGGLTEGVNQFFLIGVPLNYSLSELQKATMPYIYQTTVDWYGGYTPVIGYWCEVAGKMAALLRTYNNHTILRGCEYDPYLIAWGMEKAVVSNMQAGNYALAAVQYEKWTTYVNSVNSCTCSLCSNG